MFEKACGGRLQEGGGMRAISCFELLSSAKTTGFFTQSGKCAGKCH